MKTPTLEEVKKHFENAETVQDCTGDIGNVELDMFKQDLVGDVIQNPFEKNWLVLFHKTHGHAEILTYKKTKKSDMKKEFTITKDQIKSLYMGVGNEENLKEWFPEAFEKDLEDGNWYIVDNIQLGSFGFSGIGKYTKDKHSNGLAKCDYGFNFKQVNGEIWKTNGNFRLATYQEIETALISEAKRRGFKEGVRIEKVISPISIMYIYDNSSFYFITSKEQLWYGEACIYNSGKWAKIKEPDYDAEIEALQNKAKLDGMKAVVTFEKL